MIQSSINQMISLVSKAASKQKEFIKENKTATGNAHAALLVKQKQEQANNNFVKDYVTPGDIRRELEARDAEKAKIAAEKGIYEEDYFDEKEIK